MNGHLDYHTWWQVGYKERETEDRLIGSGYWTYPVPVDTHPVSAICSSICLRVDISYTQLRNSTR